MIISQPFGGLVPGASGAALQVLLRTGTPLTGRQVHRLVGSECSLWSVQVALKNLADLGIVRTMAAGKATLHTINPDHYAVRPLRDLADPITALRTVIKEVADEAVSSVLVFGSVARGEATAQSDVDLVVVTTSPWDKRADLQSAVANRLGVDCDVLLVTQAEFDDMASHGEPVIDDILRDGIVLYGTKPRLK